MRIYNPILYVGLGGTGLHLGSILERRFREELCGPDGTALTDKGLQGLRPFELPEAVQFVYADYDQEDINRVLRRLSPTDKNISVITDLAPAKEASYSECAASLRASVPSAIKSWIPPGDIPVAPLTKGAGQFPTAGRAALWQTLVRYGGYNSIASAIEGAVVRQASGTARGQLHQLAQNPPPSTYDVYVGFSVAGGTGCGVFYDFLYYISHVYETTLQGATVRIYPLVMLPSIIPGVDADDLRLLRLNGARALIDLFSLVDNNNSGLDENRQHLQLAYHDGNTLSTMWMKPATIPTAFVFSLPAGVDSEDMYDSVSSLVVALSGTEAVQQADDNNTAAAQTSFASRFINEGIKRDYPAQSGIGRRGVSSSVVASLEVPHDKIVSIIGDHLLARAVAQLKAPGIDEDNRGLISRFVDATTLRELRSRSADGIQNVIERTGAAAISEELNDRADVIVEQLQKADEDVRIRVGDVAAFWYRDGLVGVMSEGVDPFRAQRVVSGHTGLKGASKGGLDGWLNWSMRSISSEADFVASTPPIPYNLRDRFFGLLKLKPGHHSVQAAILDQNDWFDWSVKNLWSNHWQAHQPNWQQTVRSLEHELGQLCVALTRVETDDANQFSRGAKLYENRRLVRYRLPRGNPETGLYEFYNKTVERIREVRQLGTVNEAKIFESVIADAIGGQSGWRPVLKSLFDDSAEAAVSYLQDKVRSAVRAALQDPARGPMLPSLQADLKAAIKGEPPEELMADLGELVTKAIIPGGPGGPGRLRMLVSYPADAQSDTIEGFLKANIPEIKDAELAPNQSEMLSVVMHRTQLGLDEVREIRLLIGLWTQAAIRPLEFDKLYWRQRLGYAQRSLQITPAPRAFILNRILLALWSGLVECLPDVENPTTLRIRPHLELREQVRAIELGLHSYDQASGWASVVDAYETFVMTASDLDRDICSSIITGTDPQWIASRTFVEPSEDFVRFLDVAKLQPSILRGILNKLEEDRQDMASHYLSFWTDLYPTTLKHRFEATNGYRNLADLLAVYEQQT
ncbi:tubulin-like doman-containing protein [bacterium]|nr:tubulin-like doman-containing protein [bacterium]